MKNWKEWKSDNDDEIIVTVDKKETSSGSTFDNALRFVNQFDNTLEILRHYESQGYEVAESNIDYYLFKKVKKDAGEPTVADIPVGHAKIVIADDGFVRCSACGRAIRYPLISFSDIEYCPRCGTKIDQ